MDTAIHLALQQLRELRGRTLWVVDEHIDASVAAALSPRAPATGELLALGNRCDVIAILQRLGIAAQLSDYEIQSYANIDNVVFRVAKEKAVVHHVINRALAALPVGGALVLSGYKDEGIKTYIDKAIACAQGEHRIERSGGAYLAVITRGATLGAALDDKNYATPREMTLSGDMKLQRETTASEQLTVWTKPGVFGWQKIDAGSAFLCEHLAQVWKVAPSRVLDLGCGYGYLTLRAAELWPNAEFCAVDNNIAAVAMCARNLTKYNINGRSECCDCGNTLQTTFDAVLCNPPFHQGFEHEGELTQKFLRQIYTLLQRGGRALLVVNQFIALEKLAANLFGRVEVIARNKSFKLVVLEH